MPKPLIFGAVADEPSCFVLLVSLEVGSNLDCACVSF